MWIEENSRPVVTVTGSHRHSCLFGALDLNGRQLFRQYDNFNEDTFYEYLKQIHHKFPNCYLFLDKAAPHYKSQKIRTYFDEHQNDLIPVWLPTASPEFMALEECWNISKNELLVLSYYPSFTDFKNKVVIYFRSRRFRLDIRKYLLRDVS